MGDLSGHFSRREFACRCCGGDRVDLGLVSALEQLRSLIDRPIRIVSGYRCPDHNRLVGGAPNSYHTQGKAADIVCSDLDIRQTIEAAEKVWAFWAGGIGAYPERGFVHVDIRPRRARWGKLAGAYARIEDALKILQKT